MKLLAFETATEACSVALWIDGEVRERHEVAPRRHAELALPWADALLAEAGIARSALDAIAVGRGPGAFTGVRLAIALAQGVALGLDRPVVPVSTLAALARPVLEADRTTPVLTAIDARMDELYVGGFARVDGEIRALGVEALMRAEAVTLEQGQWRGVGSGFAARDGALAAHLRDRLVAFDGGALPHAGDVAHLGALAYANGGAMAAERVEPAYLRNDVALTLVQQQALRASKKAT